MEQDWKEIWADFCRRLQASGELLLDAAPDELDRAEALRYVTRLVASAVQSQLEPKWATAPAVRFGTSRIGGDNPDYRYGNAMLDGRLRYRLKGRMNGVSRIAFSTFTAPFGTSRPMLPTGALDSDSPEFVTQPDGSFDIILSSQEEAGVRLPMTEETTFMMVRELRLRPYDAPADYELTSLSPTDRPEPMGAEGLRSSFLDAHNFVIGTVERFLGWTETFRRNPNQILPLPPELDGGGADRSSQYYNGYYDLPDEQHALVVRFTPPSCAYWNLQALDHWLESLDTPGGTSHYNLATATLAGDGSFTAVIAPQDPGVPNWMDTAGHLHGGIVIRAVGCADPADIRCECEVAHVSSLRGG